MKTATRSLIQPEATPLATTPDWERARARAYTTEKKRRVVQFLRVSCVAQSANDNPEQQVAAMAGLERSRGPVEIVACIDDGALGLSASKLGLDERPDLLRLKELCDARAFDELWVQRIDRITRHADPLERVHVLSMLRKAGAIVVEASGGELDPRTMAGELVWFMKTIAGAEEAVKIGQRSRDGRMARVVKGRFQGRPPYARTWDKRTGEWGVVPEEVAIYERIFREILDGKSTYAIAAMFSEEGIPPPRARDVAHPNGKRTRPVADHQGWSASAIRKLIMNPSAYGEIVSMGVPLKCPPIVDRSVYNRANAMLKENRSGRPSAAPVLALLRRIAVCGMCGAPLYVKPCQPRQGPARYYYVCRHSRTARTPECRKYHQVLRTDERAKVAILRALAAKALPEVARISAEDKVERVKAAKADLGDLDREIDRLLQVARHVPDERQARVEAAMERVRKEYEQAKEALAKAEAIKVSAAETIVDRKKRAELLARAEHMSPQELREFVTHLFGLGDIALLEDGEVEIRGASPRL